MSGISEIPPFSFEVGEINDQMLDDLDKAANAPPHSVVDAMIKMLTHEIRRLREVIRKRNHCDDCGKLNPVDNICEECWRDHGE